MSLYILGFVVALVLAALVVIWIAYCMFVRERHKSEFYHHNITDIQRRKEILDQTEDEVPEKESTKKDLAVGVFVLPSRHTQKSEGYEKRPDYPETPARISTRSTDQLIDMFEDTADVHYKDGIYEVDSPSHHSGGKVGCTECLVDGSWFCLPQRDVSSIAGARKGPVEAAAGCLKEIPRPWTQKAKTEYGWFLVSRNLTLASALYRVI